MFAGVWGGVWRMGACLKRRVRGRCAVADCQCVMTQRWGVDEIADLWFRGVTGLLGVHTIDLVGAKYIILQKHHK